MRDNREKPEWEKQQDRHMFSIERESRYDQLQALIEEQAKDMRADEYSRRRTS